jgi:phage terminase large subunit-like protein
MGEGAAEVTDRDYVSIAADYQADVLAGRTPACKWVRHACERNRRDLDRQETAAFPYRFDPDSARRICVMAEMLPHIKGPKAKIIGRDGAGRPIWNPIHLEPWQCWYLTTMFGWVHQATGLRRFRVSMLLVPRKNAKSTIAAVVVLYMLTSDGESGAECYSAATTRDQAKVVAEIAWEMAKRSPSFCEYFGVRVGAKTTYTLTVPETASKFAPLSADAHTLDALNISLAIVDELHAHKTRAVWDVLDTATGARTQPLLLITTTAGIDVGGICHEKMTYLHKVLDSSVDDEAFFGINYTIDEHDDYRQTPVLRKANPNFGVSVDPEDLQRKVNEAQHSQAAINNFLTKHANVWIRTESAWMSATLWQTCTVPDLSIEELKQFPCWIGVDLAEVRDIAALVAIFRVAPDTFALLGRFYLPEAAVDKSPIAQLSGWVRQGFIIETDGDQADFARIQADVMTWCDLFRVREVDFDRALAAHMQQDLKRILQPRMGKDAVDRFVVTVPQTVETMDPAMKMTERLVLAKKLQHDGNPAMAWMISNVVVERNFKDEIYPRKSGGKDSANKIDGPVAFWTALSRAMQEQKPPEYKMLVLGGAS